MSIRMPQIPRTGRLAIAAGGAAALIALGVWLPLRLSAPRVEPAPSSLEQSLLNLGFDYLPITPEVAVANRLGLSSGVLVIRVASGSPADQAGLRVGDVLTSFDGVALGNGTSLLEMLISCPSNGTLDFVVCGQGQTRAIRMVVGKTE